MRVSLWKISIGIKRNFWSLISPEGRTSIKAPQNLPIFKEQHKDTLKHREEVADKENQFRNSGVAPMIFDDNNKGEFPDLNNNLHDVDSEAQTNGVKGEEVGSGDDALPPYEIGEDAKGGNGDAQIGQGDLQVSRQLIQESSACWEKFLHVRSIKVLLVEDDDSTRHVVTALLRNCNYEVIEAANGLHAWEILEDLTNHIDLILSEVVMPCLSGVGLLCKIMSHKTRKSIPMIMMSSHNSMGLVFKCLSKGAVDFLVKPIRKNELRNLWQHVWRRCHSSSGSGSESGTQPQNSGQLNGCDRSDDESGSDDVEENGSMGVMKDGDGSDSGSGTQSYWKKQAVEPQISHAVLTLDQVAEHPDRTCAQVICPTPLVSATLNCLEQGEHLENIAEIKELGSSGTRTADLQFNCLVESPSKDSGRKLTCLSEMNSNIISKKVEKGEPNRNSDKVVLTDESNPQVDNRRNAIPKELANSSDMNDKVDCDSKGPSVPEIILKRSGVVKDSGKAVQDHYADGINNNFDMGSTPNKVKVAEGTTSEVQGHQRGSHSDHILNDKPETPSNYDDLLFNKLTTGGPHCGPSNVKDGPIEGNAGNYSLNRNALGSNHGNNGQSSSSTVANAGETNANKIDVVAGKSGGGDASVSDRGYNIDQNNVHREALLNRFRQKRKQRCFQKKVRYHSRKRLAEQKTLVREQFVRQSDTENSSSAADS